MKGVMMKTFKNCVLTAADGCGRGSCTPPPNTLRNIFSALYGAFIISLNLKPKSIIGIVSIVGFRLFINN
jgi:hypothetical protein